MIRFILVLLFVVSFLILTIPVLIVKWVMEKLGLPVKNKISQGLVQWAFKVVLFISGTKITVKGLENIPADSPVLFVGNHRSYFDIVISYALTPKLTGYVAKKEMLRYPLLNTWMTSLHCLFLDRKDIKEGLKTILLGVDYMKSGISICIFPEGTRSTGENMLPFKEGSLKLAEKSNSLIIPMAFNNTSAIFEDHIPHVKRAHVVLEYGTPIDISKLSKEEKKFLGSYTRDRIQEMYERNKALV